MLLVDKPEGPSSHDAVDRVRRALGVRRVGHTGTLDPLASGLLVMLVGRATRLAQFLVGFDKRYEGVIRLGQRTTTDDREGEITEESDGWRAFTDTEIHTAMTAFEGTYQQRPPSFSAKKISGERAHQAARRGETPAIEPASVRVHRFEARRRDGRDLEFDALVGSGTYIRALARDLGATLGCGAYLASLRRTAVGPFGVDAAVSLDAVKRDGPVGAPRMAVAHLPVVVADARTAEHVRHGRAVAAPEGPDGPVAVLDGDQLLAVADRRAGQLQPRVVLTA